MSVGTWTKAHFPYTPREGTWTIHPERSGTWMVHIPSRRV
jgi:hypothetical protein